MTAPLIDRNTFLTLEYASRRVLVGDQEPDRFVNAKSGVILADIDDKEQPIGEFECSVVDVDSAWGQEALWDIFDASSSALAEVFDVLYEKGGPQLRPPVTKLVEDMLDGDILFNQNVLHLSRLELQEPYRGLGLGLRAIEGILRAESASFGLAVLKAFPLQYNKGVPVSERQKEFKRDTRKLMKHYEQLGFRAIARTPFMVLPHLTFWRDTAGWC